MRPTELPIGHVDGYRNLMVYHSQTRGKQQDGYIDKNHEDVQGS